MTTPDDDDPPRRAPTARRRPHPGTRGQARPGAARRRRRRRAMALGAMATAAAVVVVVIASSLGGGRPTDRATHHAGSPVASRTRSDATTTSRTTTRPAPTGPFAVRSTTLALAEPASASAAPAAGVRPLPTVVRYPLVGGSARSASGGGGFPLVVFSQGFDIPAEAYASLLHAWSAAGYVVADPTYPHTAPTAPDGLDENDIVNHPADLRFVIGAVIRAARSPRSPLRGLVNPREVAVVGQSDGGDVSLAAATNSCCRVRAIRAAVILSGAELGSFGGSYDDSRGVPLLVVQGSADTINPPGCSALLYDQAPRPKYYVNVLGAEHLTPYLDPGPARRGVARVVVAFLDSYLRREPARLRRLAAAGTLSGGLRLSSGTDAPVPQTGCPGAP